MHLNQKKIGVFLSYLSQLIQIISSLIYTPLMLKLLGENEYGLYQLVFSTVSYLGLLSFGFNSSYLRFYSKYKVENDEENIKMLNGMFLTIFTFMGLICIICGFIMLNNLDLIFGSGLSNDEYRIAKILSFIMIINVTITFPNSVFDCIITAHEKFLFQKIVIILQNLLNPCITLPLLLIGYGSISMVLITTFLTLLKTVLNIYYCFNKLSVKFKFKDFKLSLLNEIWIFTFFIFINQIIDQINWNLDKFLLGRMCGTISVAIYGVGAQINNLYQQFATSLSSIFSPKINLLVSQGNTKNINSELTSLFTRVGRIQFLILFLILSGFILFGDVFITLWAGKEYMASYIVAILLITPATIPYIQTLGIEIQRAKNMHKARSIVYLLIAIINIAMSIPLIIKYGAVGAALATAISLILGTGIFMNYYYHYKIGLDMKYFWANILNFFPAIVISICFGLFIRRGILINSWFMLFISIVLYSLIYILSFWYLGLNQYEKHLIIKPLRKMRISFLSNLNSDFYE